MLIMNGSSKRKSGEHGSQAIGRQPALITRRRRALRPFILRMGPVALCMSSVLLIALMAVLYLSQQGQAVAANKRLQDIRNEEVVLQRQDQDLLDQIASERSPAYIIARAEKMGLVPADPKNVRVIAIHNLQRIIDHEQDSQP